MANRVDKYKNEDKIPTRSNKNKELYKQIYNAYDDFENLVVPSNAREITMSDLKKEITSRSEYREKKEVIENQEIPEEDETEDDVYDINELLTKATSDNKKPPSNATSISNGDYLKKLKLDKRRTNIEQVKEMYDEIKEDEYEEDESLLKTANLSLEILSDLKSDNDATMVSAPIKNEELPDDDEDTFYSTKYKFSKRDFEGKDYKPVKKEEKEIEEDEEEDDEFTEDDTDSNGKFFLKVLLLIFGVLVIAGGLFFLIRYLNKV